MEQKEMKLTAEALVGNQDCLDEFTKTLGVEFTKLEPGYAEACMHLSKLHINPLGSVHGGAIFTLADVVAGTAMTAKTGLVTTVDSHIHYLNPALLQNTEKLYARTRELKCGKTLAVYEVDITDDRDILIATVALTFYVMPKR